MIHYDIVILRSEIIQIVACDNLRWCLRLQLHIFTNFLKRLFNDEIGPKVKVLFRME